MDTQALHDLTAAYALGALDDDERRAYEAHLARCERCREELASLTDTATALAYATDAPAPPAHLRERVLTRARAERSNVMPLRRRLAIPAAATAALAVAATIALAIWATSLSHQLHRERTARSNADRVATILAASDTRVAGRDRRTRVLVRSNGQAALVVTGLPKAGAGKTYEAWVANGGAPLPAGTFDASGETTAFALDRPVASGAKVLVTKERAGGTEAPTSRPLIAVST